MDYLCCQLDSADIQFINENYIETPDPPGSLEFLEAAKYIMTANRMCMPATICEAMELYIVLVTSIENYANNH